MLRVTYSIRNYGVLAYVTIFWIQIIPWQRSWNADIFHLMTLMLSFLIIVKNEQLLSIGKKY